MLSISDWISFLISEKNPSISNIVSIGAFMLAAFAVIMSTTNNTLPSAICAALIGVALIIYFCRIGQLYGTRAKIAEKLLDDIMRGKERDLLKIEAEWGKVFVGKKQKSEKE